MMNKALQLLSLARKGGRIEVGEEPVGAAARANHARLIVIADDASDHTLRRAKSFVSGTSQPCLKTPFSKDELGTAVGRTACAVAALTDPALALAFVEALDSPEQYADLLADLNERVERIRKHQREEKAHKNHVRRGKK